MKKKIVKSLLILLTVGSLLMCLALLFVRFWLIPHLDNYRPTLERYLSESTGRTIQIGRLSAQTEQLWPLLPVVDAHDIRILDSRQQPVLTLGHIQARISFISLLTVDLDELAVEALSLDIHRDAKGQFTIAGFPISTTHDQPSAGLDWLFSQKKISLRQGTLRWIDEQPHLFGQSAALPDAVFSDVDLTLTNGLGAHRIRITAKPPTHWGEVIQLEGRFRQPFLGATPGQWQKWTGSIDAQIQRIPDLAHHLKAQMDWPLKDIRVEGEDVTLAGLPRLARLTGETLPHQEDLALWLEQGRAPQFKFQAKDIKNDQLTLMLETGFINPDLNGKLSASWRKKGDWLDATAQVESFDLTAIRRYLPTQISEQARQMVLSAVQKGTLHELQIQVKGALSDLPFPEGKAGKIHLSGTVTDGQLSLPPKDKNTPAVWPALTKAHLAFELNGAQLEVKNIAAQLADLTVKGALHVPNVHKPVLDLKTEWTGDLGNLVRLLNVEPLKTALGSTFVTTQASGLMNGQLDATVPIDKPAQSKFSGYVQFQKNRLVLDAMTPAAHQVQGKVHFSHEGFQLENIRAVALGGELKLSGNQQKISGTGVALAEGLADWSVMPFSAQLVPQIKGRTPYQFSLDLKTPGTGLIVDSSLSGFRVNLPAPLNKPAGVAWPLRVQYVKFNPTQARLTISLANRLAAEYWTQGVAGSSTPALVQRGAVVMGSDVSPTDVTLPDQEVSTLIRVDQFDLAAWNQLFAMDKLESSTASSPVAASYVPTKIIASVGSLRFANRHFSDVVIGASRTKQGTWRINANANHFSGYAEYRGQTSGQAGEIYLRLARLVLPDVDSQTQVEQLLQTTTPEQTPALDMVVDDFEMMGRKIGRVELLAINQKIPTNTGRSIAKEWRLQKINITNPEASLKASGVWIPARSTGSTNKTTQRVELQFNLDVADAGAFLTRFGVPKTLKDGKGTLQGSVGWTGAPWSIHYPSLSGQIRLDMGKGQFLKIEPGGAGRFFSVLSLQALPKLLTLDFRDVFSEGFAFDQVVGDARITDGVMSTQNLEMKSVLALVSMQGTVDIAQETQNLHVLVLPDINAGGASLIATLVNPVVGAATYLTQLILRRPLISAATKEYSIQGSWQNPVIAPVKK